MYSTNTTGMNRVKAEWLTIGTGDIIPPTRKRGEEVDRDALTGEDGGMPGMPDMDF